LLDLLGSGLAFLELGPGDLLEVFGDGSVVLVSQGLNVGYGQM